MRRLFPHLVLAVTLLFSAAGHAEDPLTPEERGRLYNVLNKDMEESTAKLAKEPNNLKELSRRGDTNLFLGRFKESVADFNRMIQLDPSQDAPHWRLGIALYFAGEYEKSARQFVKYHAYDPRDRENGIWKFMAQMRTEGVEKARKEMLPYTQFDREPFPSLYDLYAGKMTTDEFFADLKRRRPDLNDEMMFFANYYTGLYELMLGNRERARELLRAAVKNPWAIIAEQGPTYMWHCARLHSEQVENLQLTP